MCLFSFLSFFTSSVLPELGIINLLKQLLCINCELISLSLLDWSEVDLLLRCCILGILLFPFIFVVYFVYDFVISN